MREEKEYTVADYYPNFRCKMGACRASCCEGWTVSMSMSDYFRLLGMECEKELRGRLDCAMHIFSHPTPERYAEIHHRYDGNCPLRMEDGRCSLHARLGEDALPDICRLYPRAIRGAGDDECSCANSCEAVVEQMMNHPEKLSFISRKYAYDLPKSEESTVFSSTISHQREIRMHLIEII